MFADVKEIFGRYWEAYGGWPALWASTYLHLAILLLAFTCNFWLNDRWWDQSISVLPNILGFSLGGFAMFLGFGDEKFRALLAEPDDGEPVSIYLSLCASFVHFILIQFLALAFAILALSLNFYYPWPSDIRWIVEVSFAIFGAVGYLLFLYSLTSMFAATMAVFRTCYWYDLHQRSLGANNTQKGQ